jgi:uncharacterized protein (TIGR01244 family)
MPRTVIVGYRPKPGKDAALLALTRTHLARLYEQGLVTRKKSFVMRAVDGTLVEVFEWKSQRAIDEAHHNPAVVAMWSEYAEVCEYVPVGSLTEAAQLFSGFESLDLEHEVSKSSRVFNHVQVDGRLATSGALSAEAVADIAAAGYRHLIDLLPSDNRHALPEEHALAAQHGLSYAHIPVDFAAPTSADLEAFEQAMQRAAGDKVWVHCAANMRVSAFVSLYGRRQLGWSAERAEELLAEVWQPDAVWQAFIEKHATR